MRFYVPVMEAIVLAGWLLVASGCADDKATIAVTKPSGPVTKVAAAPPNKSARAEMTACVNGARERLAEIDDYTYTLRKQERVDNKLLKPQQLATKIRHEPFSVYLRFLAPADIEGKEAIYIEGKNDGKLIGHGVGLQGLLGTQKLDPKGTIAMMGNRNPITDSGMKNLLTKLSKQLERDDFDALFEVKPVEDDTVDNRPCQCFEIHNTKRSKDLPFAKSKTCFDREWKLPVRFQRYYWSSSDGGEPILVEDYTYQKVKFDVGLTDKDFDPENPDYEF